MFDSQFVRNVARGTVAAISRFDPTLCGKVVRTAAVVALSEFLSTVVMNGLPTNLKCSSSETPIVVYTTLLFLSGAITFQLCVLAVLWEPLSRKMAALDERRGG